MSAHCNAHWVHTLAEAQEIARRVRLQEVVRRLSAEKSDIARLAIELGYVDQAHLTNDFRRVANVTPGAYIAALTRSQAALDNGSSSPEVRSMDTRSKGGFRGIAQGAENDRFRCGP